MTAKQNSLRGRQGRLTDIKNYLRQVVEGKLPVNVEVNYLLQDMFNLLPDVTSTEMVQSMAVKTNDAMLMVYVASQIRAILALHNLINNKIDLKESEVQDADSRKKDKGAEKDQDAEGGPGGGRTHPVRIAPVAPDLLLAPGHQDPVLPAP